MKENIEIISGWYLGHISLNDGGSGMNPYLINDGLGIKTRIPNTYLHVFGLVVHGPCLGIGGVYRTDNMEEQRIATVEILSLRLKNEFESPEWWDIRKYLRNYKGKRRHGEIIPMSKVDSESIKRTIDIIENEWQEIYKSVEISI